MGLFGDYAKSDVFEVGGWAFEDRDTLLSLVTFGIVDIANRCAASTNGVGSRTGVFTGLEQDFGHARVTADAGLFCVAMLARLSRSPFEIGIGTDEVIDRKVAALRIFLAFRIERIASL